MWPPPQPYEQQEESNTQIRGRDQCNLGNEAPEERAIETLQIENAEPTTANCLKPQEGSA